MIKSKIDGKHDFLIEKTNNKFIINGEETEIDFQQITDNNYHIIHNHKSFKVQVIDFDMRSKVLKIKVNQHSHTVYFEDENDLLLQKMGFSKKSDKKIDALRAPMPGLIIEIRVSEGEFVNKGAPLVILKAMKMENILKSPHDGIIKKIMVEENQKIEKDAIILQF